MGKADCANRGRKENRKAPGDVADWRGEQGALEMKRAIEVLARLCLARTEPPIEHVGSAVQPPDA